MEPKPRLGRIRYINVLPIYYAIDQAWVDNGFHLVSGTPAELNTQFHQGLLDVSAISSYEYGRNWQDYLLLPQLSIATQGDVGSVLFFSRLPFHRLSGKEVLLSAGSATSVALVKIVLTELYGARPLYRVGPVTDQFIDGCYGLLAIGDEALRLKARGCYPYFLDLGRAWHDLTGLPFVFGVWAARRDYFAAQPQIVYHLHRTLLAAKALGLQAMAEICRQAAKVVPLPPEELAVYFQRLDYDLDTCQQKGLAAFFRYVHKFGDFPALPHLQFIEEP
jgi:chorismate dehydratase